MLFLADESCDALIVRTLRSISHNVEYIAEEAPGIKDEDILKRALEDKRILITEDRDFCELVFRDNKPTFGIVLVRIPAQNRLQKAQRIIELVNKYGDQLPGAMATLTAKNIRIRSLN